jgi:hypothetical protein|tara:strand:- start:1439 stop:1651 length:213 start_codon:yes stop_codon:yes gene_type:complete
VYYSGYPNCPLEEGIMRDCFYAVRLKRKKRKATPKCTNTEKAKQDMICPGHVSRRVKGIKQEAGFVEDVF